MNKPSPKTTMQMLLLQVNICLNALQYFTNVDVMTGFFDYRLTGHAKAVKQML